MARTYTLKRRAVQQAETRLRIVEAAIDLHSTLGPGRTTLSMIAERAGVQRHTLYAHFPDERAMNMACSGLHMERNPPPDAAAWRTIQNPPERLRVGLRAIYGWYQRNAGLAGCVLRDIEYHAVTREVFELRLAPVFAGYGAALGAGLTSEQGAMLHVALGFATWRTLTQDSGLDTETAAEAMVKAIEAQQAAPRVRTSSARSRA